MPALLIRISILRFWVFNSFREIRTRLYPSLTNSFVNSLPMLVEVPVINVVLSSIALPFNFIIVHDEI